MKQSMQTHAWVIRCQFLGVLLAGSVASTTWLGVHIALAQKAASDAQVINYAGRLRYYTQHVGLRVMAEELVPTALADPSGRELSEIMEHVKHICRCLSGESTTYEHFVPEATDESVRASIRAWHQEKFNLIYDSSMRISELRGLEPSANTSQAIFDAIARTVELVGEATVGMDNIVDKASMRSNSRVNLIFCLSILRAASGFFWAIACSYTFGKVWRPCVMTINKLQAVEQNLQCLTAGVFDLIVQVSAQPPYRALGNASELRHFLGINDLEEVPAIDECGRDEEDKRSLRAFLADASARGIVEHEASMLAKTAFWWSLMPRERPAPRPVAAMVSSRWWCGAPDAADPGRTVEVFVVSTTYKGRNPEDHSTLLAVRCVSDESGSKCSPVRTSLPTSLGPMPPSLRDGPWEGGPLSWGPARHPASAGPVVAAMTQRAMAASDGAESLVNTEPSVYTASTDVGHASGPLTPHSVVAVTPPPTVFGNHTGAHDVLGLHDDLAGQLRAVLERQRGLARGSSSSGSSAVVSIPQ